jgi:hypothetical protein
MGKKQKARVYRMHANKAGINANRVLVVVAQPRFSLVVGKMVRFEG